MKAPVEVTDGVPILRAPLYPSHDRSVGRRILSYLSWRASATLAAVLWLSRSDACLVYGSPLTASGPALVHNLLPTCPSERKGRHDECE